jgi:lysylphosphatidylglycerol synthetase-like protein (DUF2156 family)
MTVHDWIIFLGPLLSLICSVIFQKHKTNIDVYLRLTFALMLLTELLGFILSRFTEYINYFLYNSYTLALFLLFLTVYYSMNKSTRWKNYILLMATGLILFFIWDNFYTHRFFDKLQYKTFILGCVFTIICTLQYLFKFLQSEEIYSFYKSRSFWFSCGMLVFCIPFIPMMISYEFLLLDMRILNTLRSLLIVFMHICFIISFQWTTRR